ncbi:hypothetical protein R6Q59_026803 [Mikania micrantha]
MISKQALDGSCDDEEQGYECNNSGCQGKVVEAVLRYKILVKVQDSTGVLDLVLWDREAKKLLMKSANVLLEEILSGDIDMDLFPEDFKKLVDKSFAFKVQITDYNLNHDYKFYTISKLTQDPTILCELQKKLNFDQNTNSESMHGISQSFPSEDTINFKDTDVVSMSGDNTTPLSRLESSTGNNILEKSKTTAMNLKRNLVEVYDDDEAQGYSTNKSRTTSKTIGKENEKHNLIIPKIEK